MNGSAVVESQTYKNVAPSIGMVTIARRSLPKFPIFDVFVMGGFGSTFISISGTGKVAIPSMHPIFTPIQSENDDYLF